MSKARTYRLTFKLLVFITFCLFSSNLSSLHSQEIRQNLQKALPSSKSAASKALITVRFSHTPLIIVTGLPVKFLDKSIVNNSTGASDARVWDFGDGNTSYEQNPSHTYQNPGSYTISLTVTAGSVSSKATKKVRVYGSKATSSLKTVEVLPDFTFSPVNPEVGVSVQFKDASTGNPTSWSWDFGDGEKSTNQNPQHQYQNSGIFNVTLTVSNGTSSKSLTKTITVIPALTPGFSFSPVNPEAGELIQFQDSTSGNPSAWSWNFGDGSTSNLQNPSHLYNNAGTYTVTLTASNGLETKTASKTINVKAVIQADFTYSPTNPTAGTQIQFTDKSTGSITSWSWQFGDGGTSSQKNPTKTYSTAASYNVKLTISDGTTSNSMTQTVTVVASLVADFTLSPNSPAVGQEVQFLDNSQGSPTSWSWDFGDGGKSTAKNPTHTYSQAGAYTVKLVISDGTNSSTKSKSLTVSSTSTSKVITASSCTLADVRAAIATAKAGDTVVVPNGTATWSQALIITKGIILKAATVGGVTIKSGAAAGSSYGDPANFLVAYVPSSDQVDKPFRLSGFVLDGNNNRFTFMAENDYLTPVTQFRLDHCVIKNSKGSLMHFYGEVYGVIDNNELRGDTCPDFVTRDFGLNETTWKNFTFDFGTANNRYYENNSVYLGEYGAWNEGGLGGRYCVRYNQIIHLGSAMCGPWDMHGNQPNANLANMGAEVYGNTVNVNGKSFRFFGVRGGKALIYNNNASNAGGDSYYGGTIIEEYLDSLNPPETNPAGQPQHISDTYIFNNVVNSVRRDPVLQGQVYYDSLGRNVPEWDKDAWKQTDNFNGSSGVGVGPLSKRPSTCTTEGVAWWATDENKLYRWHNGAWELYYTPYTYPHPLRTTLND